MKERWKQTKNMMPKRDLTVAIHACDPAKNRRSTATRRMRIQRR